MIFSIIFILSIVACTQNQDQANKIDGKSESPAENQQKLQNQSSAQGPSTNSKQESGKQSAMPGQLNAQTQPEGMLHGLALQPNEQMKQNQDILIPITSIHNASYIKAKDLTNALEYQTSWDEANRTLKIGDTGVRFELKIDTKKAIRDGQELQVTQPFVMQNSESYIPVDAIRDLFQEEMFFDVTDHELKIHATPGISVPSEDDMGDGKLNGDAQFDDDPNDPTHDTQISEVTVLEDDLSFADDPEAVQETLKNVNIDNLLREAQKYLGVKYQFGAEDYEKSKRFDCSTYTRHVYRKQGVQLPRIAREQANRGTVVSRKSLRKGDLLFFYVPGRFKSNKVVGHVGIYLGEKRMIHAINKPKDGVQITDLNKPYWKESFMFGKRVAQ